MQYRSFAPQRLRQRIENDLYCFGAGEAFKRFFTGDAGLALADRVKAVVDNHADRLDVSSKVVNGREIPIISLEQLLSEIKRGDIILITTAYFREIVAQLDGIERLKDTEYCLYFVLEIEFQDKMSADLFIPDRLARYEQPRIPKVIHYCWFGKGEIPAQCRGWMESWRRYCPDYEIVEWNEDNYDVRKSRFISQAYDARQWAFVSDYARIDIINEYGGVYLDTDVELIRSLDELLKNDAFCGFENCWWVNYGLGYGSVRQNNLLAEIKDYYDSRGFLRDDGSFDNRGCPKIQTEIMERHGLKGNGTFQTVAGMTVLPVQVLCGMSSHSYRTLRDLSRTYAIHHYTASWLSEAWRESKREQNKWLLDNEEYVHLD